MNYEQKYKESLEKERIYREHLIETGDDTNEIEYIFPELINENERIRRKFIEALKECGFTHFDNEFTVQEAIDWLEKQGEQKYTWSEDDENGLGDALNAIKQARTIAKDENDMGNLWYAEHWLKSLKERINKE